MNVPLVIIQSLSGVILTVMVLLQAKGTGLGRSFASTSYHSRRGFEHLLFRFTIFFAVVFVGASVAQLLV